MNTEHMDKIGKDTRKHVLNKSICSRKSSRYTSGDYA